MKKSILILLLIGLLNISCEKDLTEEERFKRPKTFKKCDQEEDFLGSLLWIHKVNNIDGVNYYTLKRNAHDLPLIGDQFIIIGLPDSVKFKEDEYYYQIVAKRIMR